MLPESHARDDQAADAVAGLPLSAPCREVADGPLRLMSTPAHLDRDTDERQDEKHHFRDDQPEALAERAVDDDAEDSHGQGDNPMRRMVAASGVLRAMPTVAAISAGYEMYLNTIIVNTNVGGRRMSRVSHGATLALDATVLS